MIVVGVRATVVTRPGTSPSLLHSSPSADVQTDVATAGYEENASSPYWVATTSSSSPSLLRVADAALYLAKAGGRNKVATTDGVIVRDDTEPFAAAATRVGSPGDGPTRFL
jgi:hypothetical protein